MMNMFITLLLFVSMTLASMSLEARFIIRSKGSGTLLDVAKILAESYQRINTDVKIEVFGSSSGAGIAALINGSVDIANSSRAMKEKEIMLARKRGRDVIPHIIAYDALAIYVHKNNPVDSIPVPVLAGIFGEGGSINKWSEIGVDIPGCESSEIKMVGRHNTSGSYTYFRRAILGARCFKWGIRSMLSSKDVVDLIGKTPCGIGYGSLVHANPEVKVACIADREGNTCITPTIKAARDIAYPLARPLYMYISSDSRSELKAYLDWILSDEGQCIILNGGHAPARAVTCL